VSGIFQLEANLPRIHAPFKLFLHFQRSGSAAQKADWGIPNWYKIAPAFCVSLNPVVGPLCIKVEDH